MANEKRKDTTVQISLFIDKELKEFMLHDSRRCGLSMGKYLEKLIIKRKDKAPEIRDYSL